MEFFAFEVEIVTFMDVLIIKEAYSFVYLVIL